MQRRPRIGRAEEAEDGVAAVVEQRGGKGEGRVVGRLEPQLEDDASSPSSSCVAAFSSSRRLRSHGALERRSRPLSTQSVSRRSSAARPACDGSSGSDEVSPSRKSSGALGRLRSEAVAEPHARGAEAVAGDLVDGAGVEVVHERVGVAVERVGAHGRQGRGDRVERSCTASSIVAPQ